MNRDQKRILKA